MAAVTMKTEWRHFRPMYYRHDLLTNFSFMGWDDFIMFVIQSFPIFAVFCV